MISRSEILFVEDSVNDIELTLSALRALDLRDEIVVTRDGAEALDYLSRKGSYASRAGPQPRLILLDLKLPKVSGFEVLKTVKNTAPLREIPVVALTSSREERDLAEAYRLGVNSYVVKPIHFGDFVESIRHIGAFWGFLNATPSAQA